MIIKTAAFRRKKDIHQTSQQKKKQKLKERLSLAHTNIHTHTQKGYFETTRQGPQKG